MKQLKLSMAVLLICFLIGGAVAELIPSLVVAGPQIPLLCNDQCYTEVCVCDTCRIEGTGVLGCLHYYVYQSREYIGCDGPFDCYWLPVGCHEYCCVEDTAPN